MRRICLGLAVLLALAAPASAHFPWVVPTPDGKNAKIIFSDNLEPDLDVPIEKLAGARAYLWGGKAKGTDLELFKAVNKDKGFILVATQPSEPFVGGTVRYGVVAKGKADAYLLQYHLKGIIDATPGPIPPGSGLKPSGPLQFEIVPLATPGGNNPHVNGFAVYLDGKPLPGAEVTVTVPGAKDVEGKTDKNGEFAFQVDHKKHPGLYGVRAKHVEAKAGKEGDKEYKEIRHYTTLTFRVAAAKAGAVPQAQAQPTRDEPRLVAVSRP